MRNVVQLKLTKANIKKSCLVFRLIQVFESLVRTKSHKIQFKIRRKPDRLSLENISNRLISCGLIVSLVWIQPIIIHTYRGSHREGEGERNLKFRCFVIESSNSSSFWGCLSVTFSFFFFFPFFFCFLVKKITLVHNLV